jgi:hypothetical protein
MLTRVPPTTFGVASAQVTGRAGEEKHGGDNSGEPHGYTEHGFRAMCIS